MLRSFFVLLAALIFFSFWSVEGADSSKSAILPEEHRSLLEANCIACHGPKQQSGKFRVDSLPFEFRSIEDADQWQKVLNALNSGEMPPEDEKQPDSNAKAEFLDALSHTLVVARKILSDQGGQITMRRLNRREYQNTIRDLLGVLVDVSDLPADGGSGTFDTVGTSLFMTSDQFERYLEIGRRALEEAILLQEVPELRKERREVEVAANKFAQARVKGFESEVFKRAIAWKEAGRANPNDFGFPDNKAAGFALRQFEDNVQTFKDYVSREYADTGAYLTIEVGHVEENITIPADAPPGEYVLRLRTGVAKNAPFNRTHLEMGHATAGRGVFNVLGSFQITGTIEEPQILEIPVHVGMGIDRSFSFREKRHNLRAAALRFYREVLDQTGTGPEPTIWIDWVEWEGPLPAERSPVKTQSLFAKGTHAKKTDAYAREIIEQFAARAFRDKPPREDFLQKLLLLYQSRRAAGSSFEDAIVEPLSVVLASPGFLYLAEPTSQKENRTLSDKELAVRLSYFLWSAPPDEILWAAASRGDLQNRALLAQQVDRLLDDPKSREFVRGFTQQWLGLERLDFFQFNFVNFPEFDDSAKLMVKEEILAFVQTLLREDLSVRSLLKSDFVVVNGWLANFYGLSGVKGDKFVKVSLPPDSPRGGLLGMAGILAMGSNGERTSPVERGAWVMRKLLNDPPPPAPPNVPQITRLDEEMLTSRERLVAHQEQPQCASCHRKIDPIGFGLENFDAIGHWRVSDAYEKPDGKKLVARQKKKLNENNRIEWTIDPSGALYNGPAFKDFFELREAIYAQSEQFARGFTEALIEYGLGRPYSFIDDTLATKILEQAHQKDDSFRSFIHALVASEAFHTK